MTPLLGTADVASLLGISPSRVRQLIRAGRLKPRYQVKGTGARLFTELHVAELVWRRKNDEAELEEARKG